MLVEVSFAINTLTEMQDQYLREAMERMATGQYTEADLNLVANTYKARMTSAHFALRPIKTEELRQL